LIFTDKWQCLICGHEINNTIFCYDCGKDIPDSDYNYILAQSYYDADDFFIFMRGMWKEIKWK